MNIIILGIILFISVTVVFKILFFILSVLLAGAGFLIKTIVIIVLAVPVVPIALLLVGSLFSIGGLVLIIACSILFSLISESDRKYEAKYR